MYDMQERGKDLDGPKSTPFCLLGGGQQRWNGKREGRDDKMSGDTDFPDRVPTAAWRARQSAFEAGANGLCTF